MPLPLIPIAIGLGSLAAGALGLKKGLDAKKLMEQAREIGESAQSRHKRALKELDARREAVNRALEALGQLKANIFHDCLGYLVQQVKDSRSKVEGFDESMTHIHTQEIDAFERDMAEISPLLLASGAAQGIGAGAMTAFGAYGSVGLLASASTGTAISSLAGAAASKATLAWLGGGSLAAGGLGMAGGAWVLGGFVAGPALAITGYVLASNAEEALTKAHEYKEEVRTAIAAMEQPLALLAAIETNVDQVSTVLQELQQRFNEQRLAYDALLEKEQSWGHKAAIMLRGQTHREELEQQKDKQLLILLQIGKTIKIVIQEPVIDPSGAAIEGMQTRLDGLLSAANISTDAVVPATSPT